MPWFTKFSFSLFCLFLFNECSPAAHWSWPNLQLYSKLTFFISHTNLRADQFSNNESASECTSSNQAQGKSTPHQSSYIIESSATASTVNWPASYKGKSIEYLIPTDTGMSCYSLCCQVYLISGNQPTQFIFCPLRATLTMNSQLGPVHLCGSIHGSKRPGICLENPFIALLCCT